MELNIGMNTSDYECREYLASIRWKNGFKCPRCGCAEAWKTKEIKYKCKKCGYKMSVTSGTIFQDSHTPLKKWLAAIDLINTSNGKITACSLQNKLKLGSNRTAQKNDMPY